MLLEFSEREVLLLRLAMHMSAEEGGYEYPDLDWREIEKLYEKIGGVAGPLANGSGWYLEHPARNKNDP